MASALMFSSRFCPYCQRARYLLESKQIEFEEILVDLEPERRPEMEQRAGGRTSVPQIFIGERHIGGYDDMAALDRAGELDSLLQEQATVPQPTQPQ